MIFSESMSSSWILCQFVPCTFDMKLHELRNLTCLVNVGMEYLFLILLSLAFLCTNIWKCVSYWQPVVFKKIYSLKIIWIGLFSPNTFNVIIYITCTPHRSINIYVIIVIFLLSIWPFFLFLSFLAFFWIRQYIISLWSSIN